MRSDQYKSIINMQKSGLKLVQKAVPAPVRKAGKKPGKGKKANLFTKVA